MENLLDKMSNQDKSTCQSTRPSSTEKIQSDGPISTYTNLSQANNAASDPDKAPVPEAPPNKINEVGPWHPGYISYINRALRKE